MIRIASAQGFWGDWPLAPLLQARSGPIDYLVFDYLAEVTMSILQKQRSRDPSQGYARDFVDTAAELAPELVDGNLRIISNAGGVNPVACAEALVARLRASHPGADVKVGVVLGDDILADVGAMPLRGLDAHGPAFDEVRARFLSANVYFGAMPVVEALRAGCRVVITGRVTDTGLTLAPMIHHFDIAADDWNALAAGIVGGHILECGGQASGGNFTGRRLGVEEMVELGFPILEVERPGEFVVTRHAALGGEVSVATVREQLLYEIGDPAEYITPDVVVDFRSIRLEAAGANRVRVHGIAGRPATDSYKVSCSYKDGYALTGTMVYTWPDAIGKARTAGELVLERAKKLGIGFDAVRVETVGWDACHGAIARAAGGPPDEVQLRIAVRGHDRGALDRFGRDIVPLVLTGPPGATGFAGGRPRATDVVAYWPGLLPKTAVTPRLEVFATGGA